MHIVRDTSGRLSVCVCVCVCVNVQARLANVRQRVHEWKFTTLKWVSTGGPLGLQDVPNILRHIRGLQAPIWDTVAMASSTCTLEAALALAAELPAWSHMCTVLYLAADLTDELLGVLTPINSYIKVGVVVRTEPCDEPARDTHTHTHTCACKRDPVDEPTFQGGYLTCHTILVCVASYASMLEFNFANSRVGSMYSQSGMNQPHSPCDPVLHISTPNTVVVHRTSTRDTILALLCPVQVLWVCALSLQHAVATWPCQELCIDQSLDMGMLARLLSTAPCSTVPLIRCINITVGKLVQVRGKHSTMNTHCIQAKCEANCEPERFRPLHMLTQAQCMTQTIGRDRGGC